MRFLSLFLLASVFIIGLGCNTPKQLASEKMIGEKWQLKSYDSAKGSNILPTGETALFVLDNEKSLSGHTGCNGFGGDYTIQGNTLTASVFSTKRYCEESADQEQTIISVLAAGAAVAQTDGLLVLTAGKQRLVYEPFKEKVTGDPIGMVTPEEYQSVPEAASKRYTGMLMYYADTGVFTDCADGKSYSVATGQGAWLACEKAMLRMKKTGTDPALVVIDGVLVKNSEPEGREYLLKVTRFVTGSADGGCP